MSASLDHAVTLALSRVRGFCARSAMPMMMSLRSMVILRYSFLHSVRWSLSV